LAYQLQGYAAWYARALQLVCQGCDILSQAERLTLPRASRILIRSMQKESPMNAVESTRRYYGAHWYVIVAAYLITSEWSCYSRTRHQALATEADTARIVLW
jgi:hypothetical protein